MSRVITHCVSKPVDDGCGQLDGREDRLWASVVAGGHGPSRAASLRPPEHDLDTGCGVCRVACGIRRAFRAVSDRGRRRMQARFPLSFDASPNRSASEPRSLSTRETFGGLLGNARAPMQSPTSMTVTNRPGDRPFLSAIGGQTHHRLGEDAEDALVASPFPTVIERLVRTKPKEPSSRKNQKCERYSTLPNQWVLSLAGAVARYPNQ